MSLIHNDLLSSDTNFFTNFFTDTIFLRRSTEYARSTFNIAFEASPALKRISAVTDGLWSYKSALGDLGFDIDKLHKIYHGFFEKPNNNRRERSWSTLKIRARLYRGFKSELGL